MTIQTKMISSFQFLIENFDKDNLSVLESEINILGAQILNPNRPPCSLQCLDNHKTVITKTKNAMNQKTNVCNQILNNLDNFQLFKKMNCVDIQIALITKCCLSILKTQNICKLCDAILQDIDTRSKTLDIQKVNSSC